MSTTNIPFLIVTRPVDYIIFPCFKQQSIRIKKYNVNELKFMLSTRVLYLN